MTTYYGASDLPALLAEFGVDVSFTDPSAVVHAGKGIVNYSDSGQLLGEAVDLAGHEILVTLETSAFIGIAAGLTVTVEGVNYRVAQIRQMDDGALTHVWCARLS